MKQTSFDISINAMRDFANAALSIVGSGGYSREPADIIDFLQAQLKKSIMSGDQNLIDHALYAVKITEAWRDALIQAGAIYSDPNDGHDWTVNYD